MNKDYQKDFYLNRLSSLEGLLEINQEFFDEHDFSLKERIEFFDESVLFEENKISQQQIQLQQQFLLQQQEEEEDICLLDLPPFPETFHLVGIGLLFYIFPLLKVIYYKTFLKGFSFFSLFIKGLITDPVTLYLINKYELISNYFIN